MEKFAGETGGTSFLPSFASTSLKDPLQNAGNAKKNEETLATYLSLNSAPNCGHSI